jgi:hypothetical protein
MTDETDTADYRKLVVQKIAEAVWLHGLKTSGTAVSSISPQTSPQTFALAESVADVFTCTECGFIDAFIGNSYGECNDCAPRVTARNRVKQIE